MSIEWLVIRGSGLVAYVLLASSAIWGLLISTKILGRAVKPKGVSWFHESLAIAGVLATGVHIVALSVHEFVPFTWAEILVPGRSTWNPLAVAFGIAAFYGAVVISASFYLRRFIGQRAWRTLHFGSLGVVLSALVHGVTAGTDTSDPVFVAVYAASGAAIAMLLVLRVIREAAEPSRTPPRRRQAVPDQT
jgi:sulfoxide reductase heme-binding subunit YedZ